MSEPTLASLRAAGAHHHDPLRFHHLEVLAARLPAQPPAVRQVLARKLHQALQDYAERARAAPVARAEQARPVADSPLGQLLREIDQRNRPVPDGAPDDDGGSGAQLKSVRHFQETWTRLSAEQQLRQTLARAPENAGPLNSHRLMLRALTLMQTLSPDYLRRFLSQMDALLWLEQASLRAPPVEPRAGRRERRRQ